MMYVCVCIRGAFGNASVLEAIRGVAADDGGGRIVYVKIWERYILGARVRLHVLPQREFWSRFSLKLLMF